MRRGGTRLRWPAPPFLAAAFLLLAAALPGPPGGASAQETVSVRAGGEMVSVPVARHRGFAAASAESLDGRLLADVHVDGALVRARLAGEALSLRAGSPFLRLGERVRQLPNAPYLEAGRIWIPVDLFGEAGPEAGPAGTGSAVPAAPARPRGPFRVVIDPGHGGRDPGTRAGGVQEKEVVLGVARRLRGRLEDDPEIEAFLTRERDVFVPVKERSRRALQEGAHLFISIHANACRCGARGFETYFLGEARTEESKRVAMRENAALQYEVGEGERSPDAQVDYILASVDLSAFRHESNRLAGLIQNQLRRTQPGPDRGAKPGPYWVLMEASSKMPTVLVETGFVSHPSERSWLASGEGQEKLADSLAGAIRAYLDLYGRQLQQAGARE